MARELARKIGIVPGEAIYPWNAGYYKHNVPALILRGRADSVTAGGQAESFFEDGLANKDDSVLMEIPGMGHIWRTSMPQAKIGGKTLNGRQVLQILVDEFLAKHSASAFLDDSKVSAIIDALRLWIWSAPQSRGRKVGLQRTQKKLWETVASWRRRDSAAAVENRKRFGAEAPKIRYSRLRPNN